MSWDKLTDLMPFTKEDKESGEIKHKWIALWHTNNCSVTQEMRELETTYDNNS